MAVDEQAGKERRSPHRTQWAAQFAVASELCKRGYEVAFTMGNHPRKDLMVSSPRNKQFAVDVKGQYKSNYWPVQIQKQLARDKLFYVFAFVPDDAPNEFYILTQKQVNRGIETHRQHIEALKKSKGLTLDAKHYFPGIPPNFLQRHKDAWEVLPM